MKRVVKLILAILIVVAVVALCMLYFSTHDVNIAVMNPKGIIASKEREIIITASLLMLIVVIPVFIFALVFGWKYREGNTKATHAPDWEHNYVAEICWWGVPLIIILILAVITWKTSHSLNPFKPLENGKKPIAIQAVALRWKWLFIYPEEGVATVNYIVFPENTPIDFEITSDAPMNSFWIPQLAGQIYAMPSMRSHIHLIADEKGDYRGSSANISGKGFAGMFFTAKVRSDDEYYSWIKQARTSPKVLNWSEYTKLVEPSEYNPEETYVLGDREIFEQILLQYVTPPKE